ncbi:MAG: DUF4339 domain-containing protein [Oligoflexia bacterium]|nr:DUF4339 domain-containing protein [Oligoflexia bacterium]
MTTKWFYVENNNKIGPIEENNFIELINNDIVTIETYVWKKGYSTWIKAKDINELLTLIQKRQSIRSATNNNTTSNNVNVTKFNWYKIDENERIFYIKQNANDTVYGPFSLLIIKQLYEQNRVNGKSYIFTPQCGEWLFLAEIPIFEKVFMETPPEIEVAEKERRQNQRKPFVAKMFLHDNQKLYEGLCRDISIGGMQVLVSNFPASKGDILSVNVHPDNSDYHFVAKGKVARVLEGNQGIFILFTELSDDARKTINTYVNDSIEK